MLKIYRAIMGASGPALKILLEKRCRRGKEDKSRLRERMGIPSKPRPEGSLLWLHAASVGEAQSALILIEALRARQPDLHILVTTGTVTSAKLMAGRLPASAIHQFYPLDHPAWVAAFLDHWRPNAVLWMESELWPLMLGEIKRRNIPAGLVNARMSERSFRRWQLASGAIRDLLSSFTVILAQTEHDKDLLQTLSGRAVVMTDNLKYSAAPLPFDPVRLEALKKATQGRPLWLYASTHEGEETLACRLHARLQSRLPGLLTIIVPRHPERRGRVVEVARHAGLSARLRTEALVPPDITDRIYIADTLGELGLFYRLAPLACIGRSFSDDGGGGHNPIEAAQLNCAVLHGPHVQNLAQIFKDMDRAGAALRIEDEEAFAQTLLRLLTDQAELAGLQKRSLDFAESKVRVIDTVITELTPVLDGLKNSHSVPAGERKAYTIVPALKSAPAFWYSGQRSVLSDALLPFSALYLALHSLHQALAKPYTSSLPVLCLGNLVAGGSGKTPAALALHALIKDAGLAKHPCFLTRGYGGQIKGPALVDPARHSAADVGDEPLLLARAAPVIVAADRAAGAQLAEAQDFDLIIMDDGLQNPSLAKTLKFIVVDSESGFGNGRLIPAGPLRAPLAEGLAGADAFIVTGNGDVHLPPDKPVFRITIEPRANGLDKSRSYTAFCGIGRPQKFFSTLKQAGFSVITERAFPDHHIYTEADLANMARDPDACLITTEKDAVKLSAALRDRYKIDVLPIQMEWQKRDDVRAFLEQHLKTQDFKLNRKAG